MNLLLMLQNKCVIKSLKEMANDWPFLFLWIFDWYLVFKPNLINYNIIGIKKIGHTFYLSILANLVGIISSILLVKLLLNWKK